MKETKICSNPKCWKADKPQPLTKFSKEPTGKQGRKARCKHCLNEEQKARTKKKPKPKPKKEKAICSLCGKVGRVVKGHHLDYNTCSQLLVCKFCSGVIIKLRANERRENEIK